MAQPTQEYPPWLTAVPTTIYAPDGVPLTTATEVLYLPLTYYGPSIPLGPEWTYGGLTSPASTSSVMPTTTSTSVPVTTPAMTTTAIPTTSSTIVSPSSSTSAATSTSSLPSSSLPSSSITFTSSPTSTSLAPTSSTSGTPMPGAGGGLSRAQLIGVIIASILGVVFLFILALLLLLCIRRKSGKRGSPYGTLRDESFTWVTPWIAPDGRRLGEGSPRTSGEERDAFLQRSQSGHDPEVGERRAYEGIQRVPVPHDSHSSGSVSSYGAVLEKPTLRLRPETPPFDYSNARGKILSEEEIRRIEEEATLPHKEKEDDDEDLLLLPPPRLVDPARGATMPGAFFRPTRPESSQTSLAQYPDADEPATVSHARRVRVDEMGGIPQLPRPVDGSGSSKSTNGFLNSLGLNRLSKLMNFASMSGRRSWGPEEGEAGQSLIDRREMVEKPEEGPSKRNVVGLGLVEGERPISGYSNQSNGTIYYDARSSFRATPTLTNTPPTPLPRVLTPNLPGWGSASSRGSQVPPVPAIPPVPIVPAPAPPAAEQTPDILDEPAPPAVSPFTTSTSMPSLRDTATAVTSSDRTYYPFPPGLEGVRGKSWASSPPRSPLTQSFHPVSSLGTSAGITIDILEEEPPRAAVHWRELSETAQHERRGTFGQRVPPTPTNPTEFAEVGSLYSNRSQLDPNAGSRRDLNGSQGSNSSNGRSIRTDNTENSHGSDGPWLMAPPPAHIFGRPFSSEWTGNHSPDSPAPPTSPRDDDWTLGLGQ